MTDFQFHLILSQIFMAASISSDKNKGAPLILGSIWLVLAFIDAFAS